MQRNKQIAMQTNETGDTWTKYNFEHEEKIPEEVMRGLVFITSQEYEQWQTQTDQTDLLNWLAEVRSAEDELPPVRMIFEVPSFQMPVYATITNQAMLEKAKKDPSFISRAFNKAEITPMLNAIINDMIQRVAVPYLSEFDMTNDARKFNNATLAEACNGNMNDSFLDDKGKLSKWAQAALPLEVQPYVVQYFTLYFSLLAKLTLDHEGEIQPWLVQALSEDALSELKENPKVLQSELLIQLSGAVGIVLNEAVTQSTQFTEDVNFLNFIIQIQALLKHVSNINVKYFQNVIELERISRLHQPGIVAAEKIATDFQHHFVQLKRCLQNPQQVVPAKLKKQLQQSIDGRNRAIQDSAVVKETVELQGSTPSPKTPTFAQTQPLTPRRNTLFQQAWSPSPKNSSQFQYVSSYAELSLGEQKSTAIPESPRALSKMTVILTQGNNQKNKFVLEDSLSLTQHEPVAILSQLPPAFDFVKMMTDVAAQFRNEGGGKIFTAKEAESFIADIITHVKSTQGLIHLFLIEMRIEDYYKAQGKTISPKLILKQAQDLMHVYESITEQLHPCKNGEYLPSDVYIHLAKMQFDFCLRQATEPKPTIIIGSDCFDPNYLKALILVCQANGCAVQYNRGTGGNQGWRRPLISEEESAAFKEYYQSHFSQKDADEDKGDKSLKPGAKSMGGRA